MKRDSIVIMFIIAIVLMAGIYSYSEYGAPSEFGNETNTTCFIGGDLGIVNCTGDFLQNTGKSHRWSDGSLITVEADGDMVFRLGE